MNPFRRWTTSIMASFEAIINQVENHEAMVTSAIYEVQEAGGKAKAQLARVQRDGTAMRKRLVSLREEEELWKERALKTASLDEKKAFECLKRRKRIDKEIAELEVQEREHAKAERQLADDLVTIEERLSELKRQRNLLRTRQSRAEALRVLQQDDRAALTEIDQIFERWEEQVAKCEFGNSVNAPDSLTEEFTTEEEQAELKAELQALVSKGTSA